MLPFLTFLSFPLKCFLNFDDAFAVWQKILRIFGASLVAQRAKNLPTMQDAQVQSLGQEDPMEKEKATHFRILAWEIPWTEEPDRLQSMGMQKVGHDWKTNTYRDFQDDKMNALSLVL